MLFRSPPWPRSCRRDRFAWEENGPSREPGTSQTWTMTVSRPAIPPRNHLRPHNTPNCPPPPPLPGSPTRATAIRHPSASLNPQSALRPPQFPFRLPPSAFRVPYSAIRTPHSAFRIPKSRIQNQKSKIKHPHPAHRAELQQPPRPPELEPPTSTGAAHTAPPAPLLALGARCPHRTSGRTPAR